MLRILSQGGLLMAPLLICSLLALTVIIDRAMAFHWHKKHDARALRAQVLDLMAERRPEDAAVLCASTPGPISAVLLAGVQSYVKHKDIKDRPESITVVMEKAMDDYSQHAMSAVEKRLNILDTIGSAAPLLGMTGTVTGMIGSFGAMKQMGGLDAGAVAGGIAEALITTATGLLIALGAVIPFHVFTSMADKIDLEIKESASELLDCVATGAAGAN